ncbi:unnamed protein product [Ambrosiozyma monospora]|uniref:Unnamed protein product n=1 Tax=Ambrosiozyma monospora TaxID=43982 RepID=A0ACB5U7F0_AMBMO|nr:unnamed protein product [Ambrosiozyma monospora]
MITSILLEQSSDLTTSTNLPSVTPQFPTGPYTTKRTSTDSTASLKATGNAKNTVGTTLITTHHYSNGTVAAETLTKSFDDGYSGVSSAGGISLAAAGFGSVIGLFGVLLCF